MSLVSGFKEAVEVSREDKGDDIQRIVDMVNLSDISSIKSIMEEKGLL